MPTCICTQGHAHARSFYTSPCSESVFAVRVSEPQKDVASCCLTVTWTHEEGKHQGMAALNLSRQPLRVTRHGGDSGKTGEKPHTLFCSPNWRSVGSTIHDKLIAVCPSSCSGASDSYGACFHTDEYSRLDVTDRR